MVCPKVVMLIFASGKVVFTGAKTRQDIILARDMMEPVLRKFMKKKVLAGPSLLEKIRSSFKV